MRLALAAIALAAAPAASFACVIDEPPAGWRDRGISVGPNCAFAEAGASFHNTISGKAAVDIGGGRVGQRVSYGDACGWNEELWVVDCASGETIGIDGPFDAYDGAGGNRVDLLYPPYGRIRLSARSTSADLVARSERAGYGYSLDLVGRVASMQPRNRPDPFCGCRLFYPNNPGASE